MKWTFVIFAVLAASVAGDTTEAPATEAPATEASATEAPATEASATEAPATEAPATEAPATEAPATEAPATEASATEAPATEAPATEAPTTTAPAAQLSAPAPAGQNVIQVSNQADFAIGEGVVIDANTSIEEHKTIVAFSSIVLDSTLQFDHSVNATVHKEAANPVITTVAPVVAPVASPCTTVAPVVAPVASPCAPVVIAAPVASPCAPVVPGGFAKLYNGKGTADKKSQTSPFSLVNLGMFGFGVLCVAGIAFGVRSAKKNRSTRNYNPVSALAGTEALVGMESGSLSEFELE